MTTFKQLNNEAIEELYDYSHTVKNNFKDLYNEAIEDIYNFLSDNDYTNFDNYYSNLRHYIFDTKFYSGDFELRTADDVFAGIAISIKEQLDNHGEQLDNYGEICNIGGIERLCTESGLVNYLYYVAGEEVIADILDKIPEFSDNWNETATPETNKAICEQLKKFIA